MSLDIGKVNLKSANFNGESTLPPLAYINNGQQRTKAKLDDNDGLFLGYGYLSNIFPYKMQDRYDRADSEKEYMSITLENEYLKAVFLPELGGRLWSLFDKKKNKDLLYVNDVVRPGNLAVRNAWVAGGIEYNCGMVGHCPFTCAPMFTTTTKLEDGTPVLRMYQYERIRSIVYQMDFFLPEDSKFLYGRMRIFNPTIEVTPMYWWSNIAVPEGKEYRNIVNAHETYTYLPKDNYVAKIPVPNYNDVDITYPTNNCNAVDYFWHIPDNERKYTTYVDKEGYGFAQISTSRLQGRKLFVWGQGKGSKRWEDYLSGDSQKGEYVEIQAGLAHTQFGCLPMPPKTAWEWVEAYGSVELDPKKAHGEWDDAIDNANKTLEKLLPEKDLEKLLVDTYKMATTKGEEVILTGGGWGALENIRREKFGEESLPAHLDFKTTESEQKVWLELLENGSFSKEISLLPPDSWMKQKEWTKLIEKSQPCYLKYLHLAAIDFSSDRFESAFINIKKALKYKKTAIALFVYAEILKSLGDVKKASKILFKAQALSPNDIPLTRETFTIAENVKDYKSIIKVYEKSLETIKRDGRIKMFYADAVFKCGNVDKAWDILHQDGGIVVTDIRELEVLITYLYQDLVVAKGAREGKVIDPNDVEVPAKFDFRMNNRKRA